MLNFDGEVDVWTWLKGEVLQYNKRFTPSTRPTIGHCTEDLPNLSCCTWWPLQIRWNISFSTFSRTSTCLSSLWAAPLLPEFRLATNLLPETDVFKNEMSSYISIYRRTWLISSSNYRTPTKLQESNVFSRVCLSGHRRGSHLTITHNAMIGQSQSMWDPPLTIQEHVHYVAQTVCC